MAPDNSKTNRKTELLICLILAGVILITYWRILDYHFYPSYDPNSFYKEVQHRVDVNGARALLGFYRTIPGLIWAPLTSLSLLLDVWIWGDNTGYYHLFNLFFHIANTLCLFLILRYSTGMLWQSAVVAALFAIHPINLEQVIWLGVRGRLIATFFGLISLATYMFYRPKSSVRKYILVFIFWLLALMAKLDLIYLPIIFLLVNFWPLNKYKKYNKQQIFTFREDFPLILKKALFIIPFVLLGIFISIFASSLFINLSYDFLQQAVLAYLPALSNIPVAYIVYIWQTIIPINLPGQMDIPRFFYANLPFWQTGLATIALVSIFLCFFWLVKRRKHPYLVMGGMWYIICISFYFFLSIWWDPWMFIPRYGYIPLIGLFICVVYGGAELAKYYRLHKSVLVIIVLSILSVLTYLTSANLENWRDMPVGFRYLTAHRPQCTQTRLMVGTVLLQHGYVQEAINQMETALSLGLADPEIHVFLATAYTRMNEFEKARASLRKAIKLDPNYIPAHMNLAALLANDFQMEEAIRQYQTALEIDPSLAEAHNNLAVIFAQQKKYDEAISHLKEALAIKPDYKTAQENLHALISKTETTTAQEETVSQD